MLKNNLLLPWPWNEDRLSNCLTSINCWDEDSTNHQVLVWQPMGICWVKGGNHSIATGVLKGIGKIQETTITDTKKLFDNIYTDGLYYYSSNENKKICKVENVEFAAIFEIGRLMLAEGIRLKGCSTEFKSKEAHK